MSTAIKKIFDLSKSDALPTSLVNLETLWKENKERENTQDTYSVAFRQFTTHANLRNSDAFRMVTMAEIIKFRNHLKKSGYAPKTINTKLSAIADCYEFLKKNRVIDSNPADMVERMKVDDSLGVTPVMTEDQVIALLRQPDRRTLQGARDYAVLCFYFYLGARLSSAGSMIVSDYYEDNGYRVLAFIKKGGKKQIEAIGPHLQDALEGYMTMRGEVAKEAPLFEAVKRGNNDGTQPLRRGQFSRIWNKHRMSAGLDEKFTPHSARATMATLLDKLGEPLQNIQFLLGHANPSTTQTYTHRSNKYKDSPAFRVNFGNVGEIY